MTIQKPPYMGKRGTIEHPAWYAGQKGWGNRHAPDVYVLDVNPSYPVGTKFIDGDRTFVYGYCDTVVQTTRSMGGMMNRSTAQAIQAKAVVHVVGETKIVLVDGSSTENQWAGGYLMPRVHPYSYYRVVSNDANDGTDTTHTLDRGLITQMESGEDGFLNANPYKKLSSELPPGGLDDTSVMGINMVAAVASRYMWIQTWGPCYITGGDERLGGGANRRMAQFANDGTILCLATYSTYQTIGYALNETDNTSTWFIYLQLAK